MWQCSSHREIDLEQNLDQQNFETETSDLVEIWPKEERRKGKIKCHVLPIMMIL